MSCSRDVQSEDTTSNGLYPGDKVLIQAVTAMLGRGDHISVEQSATVRPGCGGVGGGRDTRLTPLASMTRTLTPQPHPGATISVHSLTKRKKQG